MGAKDAILAAKKHNGGSKSNGSLMRCTPLAVWGAQLVQTENFNQLKKACCADASFVHSHPIVHECCFLYCVSIGHLLNNPNSKTRAQDAFDLAYKLSKTPIAHSVTPDGTES